MTLDSGETQYTASMNDLIRKPEFPRSAAYDSDWLLDNNMGPNPLWLTEWLTGAMTIEEGMRVLDLGCGRAASSVFLAREYGARVFAADLWTSVDDNWRRVVAAGESGRVTPLKVEAHALPFPAGFFDAVVSVDAYAYFGTDQLYLYYLSRFVRAGGHIGVALPGLTRPLEDGRPPAHLVQPQENGAVFWEDECLVFHTASWWAELFAGCGRVDVETADTLADGWRLWRDWELAAEAHGSSPFPSVAESLERDRGSTLGFVRVVARRNESTAENLYDPVLEARVRGRLGSEEDGSNESTDGGERP